MAEGNIIKNQITTDSEIGSISKSKGQLLFTTDSKKLFLDTDGSNRIEISPKTTSLSWNNITDKPSTFTPAAHTHNMNEISDAANEYLNAGTTVRKIFLTKTKNSQGYISRVGLGLTNPNNQFSPAILSVGTNDAGTTFTDFLFYPNGNMTISGTLSAPTFSGTLSGNASTATYATSAGNADTVDSKHFHWSGQSGQPPWVWGGSDGANMYVYNPSNFSVADSAKLNGYASSTSATGNTIARRDANGYLYATYYNASCGAETPTTSSYWVYANSDGWFRKSSLANLKSVIGLGNYLPLTGGTLTGDLTISKGTPTLLLTNPTANTDTAFKCTRSDVDRRIFFGIGSGGENSGLYDYNRAAWAFMFTKTNSYMYCKNGTYGTLTQYDQYSDYYGHFRPLTNGNFNLGTDTSRWRYLYAKYATIQTSDEREKHDIEEIKNLPAMFDDGNNLLEKFFFDLKPKIFGMDSIDETRNNKIHIGFVAQDVASSIEDIGLEETDIELLHHNYYEETKDEEVVETIGGEEVVSTKQVKTGEIKDTYGLAYSHFIALNTHMLQKAYEEIQELKNRIEILENKK